MRSPSNGVPRSDSAAQKSPANKSPQGDAATATRCLLPAVLTAVESSDLLRVLACGRLMSLGALGMMRTRLMLSGSDMHRCLLVVHGRTFAFFGRLRVLLLDCVCHSEFGDLEWTTMDWAVLRRSRPFQRGLSLMHSGPNNGVFTCPIGQVGAGDGYSVGWEGTRDARLLGPRFLLQPTFYAIRFGQTGVARARWRLPRIMRENQDWHSDFDLAGSRMQQRQLMPIVRQTFLVTTQTSGSAKHWFMVRICVHARM